MKKSTRLLSLPARGKTQNKKFCLPKLSSLLLLCLLLAVFQNSAFAAIHYVKAGASGNGSSWNSASGDLQAMINASLAGDQVWVAAGTYKPNSLPLGCTNCGSDKRVYTFHLKNNIAIYGGFAGTEISLNQRNLTKSITTLSGDIGTENNSSDNAYHVVISLNNDNTAVLDGFTVRDGNANGFRAASSFYPDAGGGLFNRGSSPTIRNCKFVNNNSSDNGGAIFGDNGSNAKLLNCIFEENHSEWGGAVYSLSSSPEITGCFFVSNSSKRFGSAMYNNNTSNPVITNCVFAKNNSGGVGAICNAIYSSPVINNCTFALNKKWAGTSGEGYGEDISSSAGCVANISNCIIWSGRNSIFYTDLPTVNNSIVLGGFTGTGNNDANPLFKNTNNLAGQDNIFGTADDGLQLLAGSPALNAGSNSFVPARITSDITGAPRIQNGNVDMGAYEYQCAPTIITNQPQNTSACTGGTATFTVAGTSPNFTYKWYKNGQAARSSNNAATLTIPNVQSSDAGNYTVDVISDCGTVTSNAATLTVNTPPAITTQPVNTTVCQGTEATFSIAVSGTPELVTQWQYSTNRGVSWININTFSSTSVSIPTADMSGAYTVRAQVVNACGGINSSSATLTVNTVPAPVVTISNNCGSSILSTTATGTLLWSTGATTSSTTVGNAGTYTVTQTLNGCTSDAGSGTAAPKAVPSAPVVTVTNNCGGSILSTTATGSLLWSTGETSSSITVNKADTYTVTQTVNGCTSAQGSGVAAPKAAPAAPVVMVANNCGSSTLSTNATGSLLWSTGETSSSITVSNAGTYTVTQTLEGCTSNASGVTTVIINAIPAKPTITTSGTTTFCTGGSVTLSAPDGFASYVWSNGANTKSITVTESGSYSVIVTNSNGCTSAASEAKVVTVSAMTAKPAITTSGTTNFCTGGSVTLSAPDGFASYSWSNGATTKSIIVNQTGPYSVIVANVNGCTSPASDAVTVTVADTEAPVADVTTLPDITSERSVTITNKPTATDNCAGKITATTQDALTYSAHGTYTINWTYNDGNGNSSTQVQKVIIKDVTKPLITCPAPVTLCYDASGIYTIATLAATDNYGTFSTTYTITGATSRSGTGSNASGSFNKGTSTINWTVTDEVGNFSTCQTTIVINSLITVSVADVKVLSSGVNVNTVYTGYSPAATATLTATVSGGSGTYTYKWSTGATTASIKVSPTVNTTYTVTIKDALGCTQTATKQINVVDVRCGNKMDKVSVCHNGNSLCIDGNALAAHLLHGDYLGSCKTASASAKKVSNDLAIINDSNLEIRVSPNPSTAYFKLTIGGDDKKGRITIMISDELGRVIETRIVAAGQTVQVGDNYNKGGYFVQVIQASQRVTAKLLKQ